MGPPGGAEGHELREGRLVSSLSLLLPKPQPKEAAENEWIDGELDNIGPSLAPVCASVLLHSSHRNKLLILSEIKLNFRCLNASPSSLKTDSTQRAAK